MWLCSQIMNATPHSVCCICFKVKEENLFFCALCEKSCFFTFCFWACQKYVYYVEYNLNILKRHKWKISFIGQSVFYVPLHTTPAKHIPYRVKVSNVYITTTAYRILRFVLMLVRTMKFLFFFSNFPSLIFRASFNFIFQ